MKKKDFSVLGRMQQNPESANVKHLLWEYCDDRGKEQGELERLREEVRRLQEEQEKLKGKNPRGAGRKPKFTEEQKKQICCEKKDGATMTYLAEKYHCSVGLIHKVIHTEELI